MKALVVIDMQNDFISGALGSEQAQALVERVVAKIEGSRHQAQLFYTRDTHGAEYLQTQEGRRLPVPHCRKGTPGWELEPRVQAALGEGAVGFDKPVFGSRALAEYLAALPGLAEVELVGLCTDICVIANALLLKSYLPEVTIAVDAGCCAGVTKQSHQTALQAMAACQVEVRHTAQ